jgi:cytochrome c553
VFGTSEWVLRTGHAAVPEKLQLPTRAELADAPRQARILGCVSCHGENLAGREFLDVPNVVRIYAPNIPAIAARSTDHQLARAIRQGVGHDGRKLFVMPSASYQRLSDGEVAALIAYIRRLPRGNGSTEGFSAGPLGRVAIATASCARKSPSSTNIACRARSRRGASMKRARPWPPNIAPTATALRWTAW